MNVISSWNYKTEFSSMFITKRTGAVILTVLHFQMALTKRIYKQCLSFFVTLLLHSKRFDPSLLFDDLLDMNMITTDTTYKDEQRSF